MIRSVFNTIHSYWLSPEEMETIPVSHSDLKVALVVEKIFDTTKQEIVEKDSQAFLLNKKTGKLYQHLSENELGLHLFSYLFTTWIELASHIGLNFCETTQDVMETFNWKDFFVSSLSVIFQYLGSCYEILRVAYYGVPIYISLFEGVLFDPIAGALRIELLEKKLNCDLKPQDDILVKWGGDWFKWISGELDPQGKCTNQFKFYKLVSLISVGSLTDQIEDQKCDKLDKFTQEKEPKDQDPVDGYLPISRFISKQCQSMMTVISGKAIPAQ